MSPRETHAMIHCHDDAKSSKILTPISLALKLFTMSLQHKPGKDLLTLVITDNVADTKQHDAEYYMINKNKSTEDLEVEEMRGTKKEKYKEVSL